MRPAHIVLLAALCSSSTACSRERRDAAPATSTEAGVGDAGARTALAADAACDGPTFDFGTNMRLTWAVDGALVATASGAAVDLGKDVRFVAPTGSITVRTVAIGCGSISPALRERLTPMLATRTRVRVRGTVQPVSTTSQLDGGPAAPTGICIEAADGSITPLAP